MAEEKKEPGRKCFIITPIGDAASETFRMAKGVIESVIKPLLEKYGYNDIKPAYEINQTGMITSQILNRIIDDDLVIANLTGNNPNVMYELCLRHVAAKPIIHICQNGTLLPFDIKDARTIFYQNDMLGAKELKEQIELFVQEIDYTKEYIDTPIYNARKMDKLLKEVSTENKNKIEVELLQNILNEIGALKTPMNQKYPINLPIIIGPSTLGPRYKIYKVEIEEEDNNPYLDIDIEMVEAELDKRLKEYNVLKCNREKGCIFYENKGGIYDNEFRKIVNEISNSYEVILNIIPIK